MFICFSTREQRQRGMNARLDSKHIKDYFLLESLSTFGHRVTNDHLELQTEGLVRKTNKKRHEGLCIVNRILMGNVLTSIHRKTEREKNYDDRCRMPHVIIKMVVIYLFTRHRF